MVPHPKASVAIPKPPPVKAMPSEMQPELMALQALANQVRTMLLQALMGSGTPVAKAPTITVYPKVKAPGVLMPPGPLPVPAPVPAVTHISGDTTDEEVGEDPTPDP